MLTIILSDNHSAESLSATLKSVCSAAGESKPQLILINPADSEFNAAAFPQLNISLINADENPMAAFSRALEKAQGEYVLFSNSGDIFAKSFFTVVDKFIETAEKDSKCVIAAIGCQPLEYENASKAVGFSAQSTLCCERVELKVNPELVLKETSGVLFNTQALKEQGIDQSLPYSGLKKAMLELLCSCESYESITNQILKSCYPTTVDSVNFPLMHKREWYYDSLERFLIPLLENHRGKKRVKRYLQYFAMFEMKWRFIYNRNANDKHLVENDLEGFVSLCRRVFMSIDNSILFDLDNYADYRMPKGLLLAMFHIKYGEGFKSKYALDNSNILRIYGDIVLARAKQLRIFVELLEYENGVLTIEASVDDFLDMSACKLKCTINSHKLNFEETYRYAHTKYFGVSTNKRYTFRLRLRDEELDNVNEIKFYLCRGGYSVQIPISTRRYTSKFSSAVSYSYWMYGSDRRVVYSGDNNNSIIISRLGKAQRFVRELKLMAGMLTGSEKAPGMFFTRLMYWLTRPAYKNKKIWLTYDKLYKGGDCGEYFYKYMKAQNDGITPVYVINRDAEDVKRLKKEGYKPTYFGTLKNRLQYLNSDVVFATHGGVHTFNGISNSRVKFVSDLIHSDVTCIQHGLSVQQLAQELNKVYNNTKRYYCASKYEIQNLERPIYGYEDKSALRLTGIPRYDGLVSNDQKQILITPTWRSYISMPPVMGKSRPYYPEFKNTNYYKLYYNLLTDEKLIATARETGYRLIYLLHPIISSQIIDYPEIDGVEIIPATDVNYEKILTESSLMLTDYSGVQFDFAYMRKPVVYYHPPELPPHYKEGGFFYDTMGFGEICTDHGSIVDCLCEYMRNQCEMKEFYRGRADDFFAYSDLDSCKRIYDDMMGYKKSGK